MRRTPLISDCSAYSIDPGRIASLGGSDGGHLVELIGYTASAPTEQHPEGLGPKLKAIVAFYGWSDLTAPGVRDPYWNEAFLGKKYEDAPELYKEASPITHVSRESPRPYSCRAPSTPLCP